MRGPLLPPTAAADAGAEDDREGGEPTSVKMAGRVVDGHLVAAEDDAEYASATSALTDESDPWWLSAEYARQATPGMAGWRMYLRKVVSRVMPFSPRERAISPGHLRARLVLLGSLAALIALTAIGSVAAFGLAAKVAEGANQLSIGVAPATPPGGVVIQPLTGGSAPTPTAAPYVMGAWVSDSAPTAGSVQVFVRISRADGSPVGGIPVQLDVGGNAYGSAVPTNAYGLATFNVTYGGGYNGYSPVFVTASATVSGQALTAETSFAPQ